MATWTRIRDPAQGISLASTVSVQTTTDSAPTLATDGVPLVYIGGFTLFVSADVGQTLLGTGTLKSYLYDGLVGWGRADFDVAATVTAAWAGSRIGVVSGWTVANPRGAIAHITNGIGVSAGGVTLYYVCTQLKGFKG